ncbi:MAG: putative toxin-antitoxin system toxin component, PIN family [Pseudomonadota bacterium]
MIILDTNILDAALRSPSGASHYLLRGVLNNQFKVAASTALLLEYEAVLKRPHHLLAYRLTMSEIEIVLTALFSKLIPVHIDYQIRPFLSDPNDDMIVEAAVNSGVKTIVTFNLKDFKNVFEFGIEAIPPNEMVRRLKL